MNRRLAGRDQGARFATLVYGVLAPDGRFRYANAGHGAPALLTGDISRRLTVGGPMLGVSADAAYEEDTEALAREATLLLFSDGVTEAIDEQGEEFGERRLLDCARSYASSPLETLDRILRAVREFCEPSRPADDVTVSVIRFR